MHRSADDIVWRAFTTRLRGWIDRAIPPEIQRDHPIDLHRARLLVASSALASATAAISAAVASGFLADAEKTALGIALALFALSIPALWTTRSVDPASSAIPAGLVSYCVLSTFGSGGAFGSAAIIMPVAALTAAFLCTRRAATAWLVVMALAVPLAAKLSPAADEAPALATLELAIALVFAVPTLIAVLLYRGLYEQALADQLSIADDFRAATERQAILDARLRESERLVSLGRMAGGIAHDFNNILAAIGGSAELIALSPRAGMQEREHAARIGSSVDRAATLVKQLLDFTGRGRRRLERISLRRRIEESARILVAGLSKDVSLRVAVRAEVQLDADSVQIDQLIIELVQNAARAYAGKPGAIDLGLDRLELGVPEVVQPPDGLAAGSYAVLRVTDRGCGIPPENVPRIFDPFFSHFDGGRGLGLASALGIVRGHGGGIAVTSAPGTGTTLTIYLPCEAYTEALRGSEPPPPSPSASSLRGLRLLVVDDELAIREVLVHQLRDAGAVVDEACDGAEALTLLARVGAVDAALVDVSMPDVSGTQLLEALRASGRNFPVVLMTGHAEVDVARFGDEASVAVLLKPFRLDEIPAALERARGTPATAPSGARG